MIRTAQAWSRLGAAVSVALSVLPLPARSQAIRSGVALPELRVDAAFGTVSSAQLGVGVHLRSGTYVRVAALAGLGTAWKGGARGLASRLELQGRFHLDPFRDARFGLYGLGGIVAAHDPFDNWQARVVVGAGAELPSRGRTSVAVEAALAGGFRLSLVARRQELRRR